MATNTAKTLTLSRDGGGSLKIHPSEWPAMVQAVTQALQLDADPAVSFDALPQGAFSAPSPVGEGNRLVAEFRRIPVNRPMASHHRDNFGSD